MSIRDLLTDQIHDVLAEVEEVTSVDVKLVWYPAWTVEKMSRYARIALELVKHSMHQKINQRLEFPLTSDLFIPIFFEQVFTNS